MKPLNTILSRLARAVPRVAASSVGRSVPTDIAATIDHALATAGLLGRSATAPAPAPGATHKAARMPSHPSSPESRSAAPAGALPRGVSLERSFSNAAGARAYTLYIPPGLDAAVPAPLVLMLHGCTQTPADFATGTRMNALADAHGVLVAYPAQTARENGAKCWNWFRSEDQRRDAGEPSILAGIVADIAADHRVDAQRVYVAGLSAGAAMAVILGRTYPDVFAGVGAHSGLPFGAANDMAGAFAAMQGSVPARGDDAGGVSGTLSRRARRMPTIVFHGDADRTVNVVNGRAIVDGMADSIGADTPLKAHSVQSEVDGRSYTRDSHTDGSGKTLVEFWRLHGAGHAWSGGDPAGSHVDATGPDASAEMLRFFLQHANAGSA